MNHLPYSHLERGTLLVASPDIEGGLLFRSVVLLCDHSPAGSFGLIINKPLSIELPEEILKIDDALHPNIELRIGGVIQQSQLMLLHSFDGAKDKTLALRDGIYLGGDLEFLQRIATDPLQPFIRLCFGYSGWGPGQLEREFLSGNWFLHPSCKHLVFETPPQDIWQETLAAMGGRFATLSTIPEDLSLN